MELHKSGKQRIAILFGGQSTEHEVSLRSSINVIRAIDRQKYNLILIGVDKCGHWTLCDEHNYLLDSDDPIAIRLASDRCCLALVPGSQSNVQLINVTNGQILPSIDIAFSVLHGSSGEDGSVQGLLKVLKIPYAGTDVLSSAICIDKDMARRVLRAAGIPVIPSVTLLHMIDDSLDINAVINQVGGLPLFIKPATQGSSIGVSKVTTKDDFKTALELAFRYDVKVLIEKEIIGREIETAVLGNDSPEVSVVGEILTNDEFYTYNTKYLKDTKAELVIPAQLSVFVSNALRQMAIKVYLALGCSVMARVDFFLTNQGQIVFNEVNTLPGFTSMSMYPRLWEASGLDYPTLIDRLISLALARADKTRLNQTAL